jgi:2,4-dienoyl-CoA reductase (NADPH2)
VLAIGAVAHNPLEKVLKQMSIPCRVVGDAGKPGWAFDAIHQGFEAGRTIE